MEGMNLKVLLALSTLVLAACGGNDAPEDSSQDVGVNPPATVPETPGSSTVPSVPDDNSAPAGDVAPPLATLVTDGELDPLDSIVVRFDEPIDPASLAEGVLLRSFDAQQVIPLDVAYDASSDTLTLTPRYPLPQQAQYVLDLDEVTDLAGNPVGSKAPGTQAKASSSRPLPPIIRTRPNLLKEFIIRDDETGEISRYWLHTYHETGKVWRVVDMFTGPGIDGDWFDTADNERSGFFVTEMLTGKSWQQIWYDGPGGNGQWEADGDDRIKGITRYDDSGLPGQESSVDSEGIGGDGDWFTKDDTYNVVHLKRFDRETRQLLSIFGNSQVDGLGPGDDGAWFTGDDRIEYYERHQYDEGLRLQRVERFRRAVNDDGKWYSDDDVLARYTDYEYDESGRLAAVRPHYRPSFAEDAYVASYYQTFTYTGGAKSYLHATTHAPEDGAVASYIMHQRSAAGALLNYGVFHGKGGDTQWFTGDDASGLLSENVLDEKGLAAMTWHYDGLGPDGWRYTGDEPVDALTRFQYDEKGRLLSSDYYISPGGDETWGTPGDVISMRSTYYTRPATTGE